MRNRLHAMHVDRFDQDPLSAEMDERVRSELRDGERLVWTGQPRPSRFAKGALPIVLFGIPWTALAIVWMAAASGLLFGGGNGGMGAFNLIFPLFGLPFVLIGFGMLSAPYWMRRKARRTCYALTDRRAILWEAGWRGSVTVRSYSPADLTRIRRVEYPNGDGDLIFDEFVTVGTNSKGHRTTHTQQHGFVGIPNVRTVEDLLRSTLLPDADV